MLEITPENFDKEVLKSDKLVLVDFWAPWCMPCKMLTPTVEKLAEELKGEVSISKCNVDDSPELATDLSVLNIPSLVLFKNGEEVARMVGVNSKTAIESKIRSFM
ncbi:MAG: thioredoxin [Candidatus Omnitrophica bacterium]|nr:thioredoxin [Candidatus Omnitrophota bacterium]MBU0881630.1 thioredoxin [Candidatus Omnitrophota bacterium]MBU1037473.1 thioredoxin [Candidatus Omnitrophota bacterium]MBU1809096.1 thioredoxin [Candidatus Omnitrophota bacterium]